MNALVLVNGTADGSVSALDRGLAYGDGLFETIRFVRGAAPLWERHVARLREGCGRLGLPMPDPSLLAAEALQVAQGMPDAVVKLVLTRGIGERGYAPPRDVHVTRIVAGFPMPVPDAGWYDHGVRVRCCALRLAQQPRLAGIKHLNRLEQVLARGEWNDPDVVEGLLFDDANNLISATAANVFVVVEGTLTTPPIETCGVAGVLRAELLSRWPDATVRTIAKNELMAVEEMFLTSSVRGVMPVRGLDGRMLRMGERTRAGQACWRALGFREAGA
jgi:4-amino-4-deoxychorismate lyase